MKPYNRYSINVDCHFRNYVVDYVIPQIQNIHNRTAGVRVYQRVNRIAMELGDDFMLYVKAIKITISTLITFFVYFVSAETHVSYTDLESLTKNCLHESVGESFEGKIEVARVVLKRASMKRYPNSAHAVIFQPSQFSWTAEPSKSFKGAEIEICFKAVYKAIEMGPGQFSHYYAHKVVTPDWSENYKLKKIVGNHTFLSGVK